MAQVAPEPSAPQPPQAAETEGEEAMQGGSCFHKFYQPHCLWICPILFFQYVCSTGPIGIFQGLVKDIYGDQAQLAMNVPEAVSGFFGFLMVPLIGRLSDHYGRRSMLLLCALSFALPQLLLVFCDLTQSRSKYNIYLVLKGLSGLGGSSTGCFGMCFVYMADCIPPERRAAISGLCMALGGGTGYMISPLFHAWVYQNGANLAGFKTEYVICNIIFVLLCLIVPESRPKSRRAGLEPLQWKDANPVKGFRLLGSGVITKRSMQQMRVLFLVVLLLYVMKMGMILSLGLFAGEVFHFDANQRSALQSVYGAFQLLGQLSIGLLLTRLSQKQAVGLGVLFGLIACSIPAVPNTVLPPFFLYVSEAFLALSFISYTVCSTIATQIVPAEFAGEAAQLINTALVLCSGLGPLLFGLLVTAFLKTPYPGGALLFFVAVILVDLFVCCKLPSNAAIVESRKGMLDAEGDGQDAAAASSASFIPPF